MKTLKNSAGILLVVNLFAGGCSSINEKNFELAEKRREMYEQGISMPLWMNNREWTNDDFKKNQRDVYLGIVFYGRYNFSDDSSDSRFVDPEEARELLKIYRWLNEDKTVYLGK